MGKCSGLKGGGHHRKAIDIADKKRNEKKARKKDAELAGKRHLALKEILSGKLGSVYQDCDIYLEEDVAAAADYYDASSSSNIVTSATELCRAHFRYDDCSNRRCKFSHEYSIAEALQHFVISGGGGDNYNNNDDEYDAPTTIPVLRYLPGIIGGGIMSGKKRQKRSRWKQLKSSALEDKHDNNIEDDGISSLSLELLPSPTTTTASSSPSLENALVEGSSVVNTIVAYIQSNQDVLHFGLTCRYLHKVVLLDNDGNNHSNGMNEEGCQDVQRRKQLYNTDKLDERNETLLKSKAVGGQLRYVVSYVVDNTTNNYNPKGESKKAKKKKNNKNNTMSQKDIATTSQRMMRPVLIYDYENPAVFRAFREGSNCAASDSCE